MNRLSYLISFLLSGSAYAGYVDLPGSGGGSGTVTGVTATAPIQSSGGTAPIISCIASTDSVAGCLSAADHTSLTGAAAATTAATSSNTNSTIVKRDGSGNFSATTITAALTGAASSNVLKAGDTMIGPLVMPAGSISTAELNGGTTNTGIFFPASSALACTVAGTEILRVGSSGLTIGNTTAQTKALYIKPGASTVGIQLENANNTRKFNVDVTVAGLTIFGQDATNGMLSVSNVATGGTGVNWFSMGADGGASPPPYPQHFNCISGDGNVTALSSIKSLDGNNVNGAPWVVLSNLNSTVNTIAQWVTTGSSKNPMAAFGSRHITQTAASEDADLMLSNQNAGTLTEHLRIKPKGQLVTLGTAPAAGTCGTSPGTPTGNDNFFKITSGTGGVSGTCSVTLATAPLTAGHCACRDKTTVSTVVDADVSGSTVTMTTYSRTTGSAINFAASDVFECQCSFF